MKVFSVYDKASSLYGNPFFLQSEREAIRGMKEAAQDKSTLFHKYPSDFELYYLGDFNLETGAFEILDVPYMIFTLQGEVLDV